jgi:hypothetical protein
VVSPKYQNVDIYFGFSEELASVEQNNKWGFVNKSGQEVIPPQYDEASYFDKGKAKVKLNGKEFEINKPQMSTASAAQTVSSNTETNSNAETDADQRAAKPIGPVVKTNNVNDRFDPDLVGTWKYEQGQTIMYWKFNADGTYDLYTGSITPANRSKGKCYWGFDKGVFTTNCEGGKYQASYRYDFEKKNDPRTGKPTIIVNSAVYTSEDNKAPWK